MQPNQPKQRNHASWYIENKQTKQKPTWIQSKGRETYPNTSRTAPQCATEKRYGRENKMLQIKIDETDT